MAYQFVVHSTTHDSGTLYVVATDISAKPETPPAAREALDLWTRLEPGARKPRYTREEITEAAVRIADADGIGALSMRRLAAELDAGTMTLYHYIRTKDELLALVGDAIMGEMLLDDDELSTSSWRAAVTTIAHRTRDVLQRHPWMLDVTEDPAVGPNGVRHFDQTLQAVASLDVDLGTKLDIVSSVDEYVFGYCIHQRNNVKGDQDYDDGMVAYVESLIDTGEYPALTALVGELGLEGSWNQLESHLRDETRFERALERILDGFQAGLERRSR
jgi:AcrR family transcriptional regulator